MKPDNTIIKANPVDAMLDGMGTIINMYLYAIIDVQDKIDFTLFQKSLYTLYLEEPKIGARYTRRKRRSVWIVDPKPQWECIEYNNIDDKEAQRIEEGFIQSPRAHINTLPISLYLLHMETCDRLIIQINHLLTDAGGIKNLLYRLFKIYNTLKSDPDLHSTTTKTGPGSTPGLLKAVRLSNIGRIIRTVPRDLKSTKPLPGFSIPMSDTGPENGRTISLFLDSSRVARLKNRWKNEDFTLNDILLSVLSSALYTCFSHGKNRNAPMRLFVTTDMRKYVPAENYIGNFSFNTTIDTEDPSGYSPQQHLEQIASKTRKWKQDFTGLGTAILLSAILRILPDKLLRGMIKDNPPTIAFTNMGLLDETKISIGEIPCINARINPPLAFPPSIIAGATGYADTLTFSLGYWSSAFKQEHAEMVITEMDKQLKYLE